MGKAKSKQNPLELENMMGYGVNEFWARESDKMRLYGLKNCDTCRKAMKALENAELVDVRADGVPPEVMARAFAEFGDALMNTRSTTWRGLDADERQKPVLELLAEHPALMKRPLIDVEGTLYLGWSKDVQAALG
ncbi:arsenate reductase [Shimia haliotis]|uniref:Arsenate reductase n=2 Tax=Shimia haliotis TaxID=1280847 RepID=A0A1I4FXZ5_9RHOB|nr:arsenate reductase [Shimia haliotis]